MGVMIDRNALLLTTLGLFLSLAGLMAQRTVSPKDVLNLPSAQSAIQLLRGNIQRLENTDRAMPFIEEMEFRTESDEMDLNRQEYLFRMRFHNRESRRVQDRINQNALQHYELRSILLAERALSGRYEYLAEWFYLEKELAELTRKKVIIDDQLRLYKTMASNALQLDIANILKAEEDLQELEQDQLQLQLQRAVLINHFLPEADPSNIQLIAEGWISIATMHKNVLQIMRDSQITTSQKLQQTEVDAAQFEYELELAESRRFLEFVQAKYAGRDNLTVTREFSFGVGFLIPMKSTNRIDINEAQLEQFDEEFQLAMMAIELEEDIKEAYQRFDQVWQAHQLLLKQIDEKKYAATLERYKQSAGVSPVILLQLQALIIKQERNLLRLEEEACFRYLKLLALKGMLHPDSKINYLSDDGQSYR
jgi:hypothetical protein